MNIPFISSTAGAGTIDIISLFFAVLLGIGGPSSSMARVDFDQPFSLKVAENISFLDIPDEMRWKRDIFYLYDA